MYHTPIGTLLAQMEQQVETFFLILNGNFVW